MPMAGAGVSINFHPTQDPEPAMKCLALLAAMLMCSGCALITAHVDIPYQAATTAAPVPGAPMTTVEVSTADARTTYRDRVGTKKNGYGMEMAAIVPTNSLPDTVTGAFRQELSARGFRIGTGGADVHVDLVRFYDDFKPGFFSGDAVATVAFTVKVTAPGGTSSFTKYYEGTGTEPNIQIMGADNARSALVKAFTNAVTSAVSDPDLIQALLRAGAPSASAAPAS